MLLGNRRGAAIPPERGGEGQAISATIPATGHSRMRQHCTAAIDPFRPAPYVFPLEFKP